VLGRDVLVAHAARLVVGALEQVDQVAAERGRSGGLAGDGGKRVGELVGTTADAIGVAAGALEHRDDDAAVLLEQGEQQMRGGDFGIAPGAGQPLRGGEGLLGLDCESISLHRKSK
jgi:hypothetical protein